MTNMYVCFHLYELQTKWGGGGGGADTVGAEFPLSR